MNDKKFVTALEKQLDLFRTATEWSDFVAYLTGLEGILRMHKFSKIPKPYLLYRRLSQCLNPALPAGVHTKALSVYKIILSRLSKESLKEDVNVLCLGLFSFYSHASLATVPNYMDIIREIVETLKEDSKIVCRNIVTGVIMGLEEENSENYTSSISLLSALEKHVGTEEMLKSVWEVMVHNADLVPGCVVLLSKYKALNWADASKEEIVAKGFSSALGSKDVVTVRKAFDILIQSRAEKMDLGEHEKEVTVAVLKLLLLKEISLFKRVQQWVSFVLESERGEERFFETLCGVYRGSPSLYFKILTSLHQGVQEARGIFAACVKWTLSVIDPETEQGAAGFFSVVNRRIVWSALSGAPAEEKERLVSKAVELGLVDEHAQAEELPAIICECAGSGGVPLEWIRCVAPNGEGYARMCDKIREMVSEKPLEEAEETVLAFLEVPAPDAEESQRAYAELEKCVMEKCNRVWKERAAENKHYVVIRCIEKMKEHNREIARQVDTEEILDSTIDNPCLFWKYNELLAKSLQNMLIRKIVYSGEEFREDPGSSVELEKAFYLAENIPVGEEVRTKLPLVMFLFSFQESKSYKIREKSKSFISEFFHLREIFNEILTVLDNKIERVVESDRIVIVDCDYNKVLSALKALFCLVSHSQRFSTFVKFEETSYLTEGLLSVQDVVDFVTGSAEASPALSIFSLLMMYVCAEYRNTTTVRTAHSASLRDEVIGVSLETISVFLKTLETNSRLFSISENVLQTLLLPPHLEISPEALCTLKNRLSIISVLGVHKYTALIEEIYKNSEQSREKIVQFLIQKKNFTALLNVLGISCALLANGAIGEFQRISHIVEHELGLKETEMEISCIPVTSTAQRSEETPKKHMCSCGCPLVVQSGDTAISNANSYVINYVINEILSVYTSLVAMRNQKRSRLDSDRKEPQEAGRALLTEREDAPETRAIRKVKRYLVCAFQRNPGVFADCLVRVYTSTRHIEFVDAVLEHTGEIFPVVLGLFTVTSEEKYAMLREWVRFSSRPEEFESEKALSAVGAVVLQTRMKTEHISQAMLFSELFGKSKTREGQEMGLKALDACVSIGARIGLKKIQESLEDSEKLEQVEMLLHAIRNFIATASEKRLAIDTAQIWSAIVLPLLRLPAEHPLYLQVLEVMEEMSCLSGSTGWKKEFCEYIAAERFFRDTEANIRTKIRIASRAVDQERIAEQVGRAGSTGFFIREADIFSKAAAIKRLRFMVLCAPFSEDLSALLGLISEVFSITGGAKSLITETYALCRALCIRMPRSSLINLWPIAISEALNFLDADASQNSAVIFSALQFLDLVATLDYPETLEFRWLIESKTGKEPERMLPVRTPAIGNPLEWSRCGLQEAIQKVSLHHKAQRYASDTDADAIFQSLIADLPEP